jgi:predicted ArsR family transcriptional regulator
MRRRLAVSQKAIDRRRQDRKAGRWPFGGPSLSSVRRWMKQAEADGTIECCGVERTGKPGRPAKLYQLTEAGKQRTKGEGTYEEELHAIRVERVLKRAKGRRMTEDEIIAAYRDAMAPAEAARA